MDTNAVETETEAKPIAEKTVEEKKESVSEKAKITKDEMKGASESSVHALLDEVRALRADLSGGLFSKQADKAVKPVDSNAPKKGVLDTILDFDFMG
jgi:hypothetical protein